MRRKYIIVGSVTLFVLAVLVPTLAIVTHRRFTSLDFVAMTLMFGIGIAGIRSLSRKPN